MKDRGLIVSENLNWWEHAKKRVEMSFKALYAIKTKFSEHNLKQQENY